MRVGTLRAIAVMACLLAGCTPTPSPKLTTLSGATMGTTWCVQTAHPPANLQSLIQTHLDAREAVLSHWRQDSALSRFNASPSTDWFAVPAELIRAVEAAKGIADQTDGALDITVAPVIDLWGFGPRRTGQAIPTEAEITAALAGCGWRHLHWRSDPPALRKDIPGLRINVAAIAEGLVMDELAALIRREGISDFLLEVGGEVVAAGLAPGGKPWQVGIQMPQAPRGEVVQTLPLSDQCLATSGTYRHHFESEGQAYSHLIDPRTGRPVTHALASVSVVDPSCARADGFATALLVLGPARGEEIAKQAGLRVFWIGGN